MTDHWLAVDKPDGWLSIRPTHPGAIPVLSDWIQVRHPEAKICHRLDLQTSGMVLFARGAENHRLANQWFSSREIKKTYHCLCSGEPSLPVLKINSSIRGVPAMSQALVKERFTDCFLAEVRLVTGRRHQIRIHLSARGHPLLGDAQYGGEALTARVALHSYSLELPSGERFVAEWPNDFRCWIEKLRANQKP